jgi:hypothetical protein
MVGTAQARLCPPYDTVNIDEKNFRIPYPRPQNLPYPDRVLFDEGSLSRSDPFSGQSESWPDRGPPGRLTAWWPVERWEALRLALGARGALPREVGTLIPPQGCPLVPWRLPALHTLALGLARDWQTSDASRRENAEVWLFEN